MDEATDLASESVFEDNVLVNPGRGLYLEPPATADAEMGEQGRSKYPAPPLSMVNKGLSISSPKSLVLDLLPWRSARRYGWNIAVVVVGEVPLTG